MAVLARLLSAAPQTDGEHWDLTFREEIDVVYTDAYAQDPNLFQRNPQFAVPNRPPYPWRPALGLWGANDALFPNLLAFLVAYNSNNSPPTLDLYGHTPVNTPPAGNAPQCPLSASVSLTGGHIHSGSYVIAIAADANGPVSPYFISAVVPSGTTTATITVSNCVWTAAAPAVGLYIGTSSLTMYGNGNNGDAWAGSVPDAFGNPTTFTITNIKFDGIGLPDPAFNSFLFQAKDIYHGGVWGAAVNVVGASGGATTLQFLGASWTTNQWVGYIVSSYAPGQPPTAVMNYSVASSTADTLTLSTLFIPGPDVGTVFVMRAKASSVTGTTIGDPNFVNSYGPTGLTVNGEIGNLVRIIAGTGKNQPPIPIKSNTATVLTLETPWAVTPDSTSIFIVEAPEWSIVVPTATILNGSVGTALSQLKVASLPMVNTLPRSLLIEGITIDSNGNWSVERYAPIREIWIPPASGTALNPGYDTISVGLNGIASWDLGSVLTWKVILTGTTLSAGIGAAATSMTVASVIRDNTACPFNFQWGDATGEIGTCTAISGTTWTINAAANAHATSAIVNPPTTLAVPTQNGGSLAKGAQFFVDMDQDATGQRLPMGFATGYASDVSTQNPITTASTRSFYGFRYDGTIITLCQQFRSNGAIS